MQFNDSGTEKENIKVTWTSFPSTTKPRKYIWIRRRRRTSSRIRNTKWNKFSRWTNCCSTESIIWESPGEWGYDEHVNGTCPSTPQNASRWSFRCHVRHGSWFETTLACIRRGITGGFKGSYPLEWLIQLIDNAGTMLSKNVEKMGKTGGSLQTYSRQSRGMTWLILGAIVAVLIAWLFMYFIIRLTWKLNEIPRE